MNTIKLGSQGLEVPKIGLGCMGMTGFAGSDMYGKADEKEAIATIHRSFELGNNFLDTADIYGYQPFENEQLVAKTVKNNRDKYIIATKFGWEIDENNQPTWNINGKPDYVKKAVERSLKSLNTDYIDLYYLHRLDKSAPVEDTVGALSELVQEGKIRYSGLCEVSSNTIRKAHAIHPLTAIQSEYSLFERTVEEAGILKTVRELGIGFVAYSPLGRGFLSGAIKMPDDLPDDDFRKSTPRFQGEQFFKNIELVAAIEKLAREKNVTSSQLALAWIISKNIVPIPGTKRRKYLEQNIDASNVLLNVEEINLLKSIIPLGTDTGKSYDDWGMGLIDN